MSESSQGLVAILARVARSDQSAFQSLYDATSAKLYGIIVRVLRNRSAADEILQEVYVKVWQNAGDFDPAKASPITWMATIARNRAIDELRRSSRLGSQEPDKLDEIAGESPHPLDSAERSDSLRALLACLENLGDERRDMILLAYYRGCSREELAQRFGKPVPTVKTWLHRGLAQLRECLA